MGNFGPKKLLAPYDNVETKYGSIEEIDLMTVDKTLRRIPNSTGTSVFVHYREDPPSQILDSISKTGTSVHLLADIHNTSSFA